MTDPVSRALGHLRSMGAERSGRSAFPLTINFHPDLETGDQTVIESLAKDGVYRSQFETGISSGGVTAYPGGDRWNWESRIFGAAYDEAPAALRPKYGALNHRHDQVGASPRFGSSHLRLAPQVLARTSFCYPDSHLEPQTFALGNADPIVAMAMDNELRLDELLDNYVEAQIHGAITLRQDVEAVVLDPSFQGTLIEDAARKLPCALEWHDGFRLPLTRLEACRAFRNDVAADAILRIAASGIVTPAMIWRARRVVLDHQTAKWVWHCLARFGGPAPKESVADQHQVGSTA